MKKLLFITCLLYSLTAFSQDDYFMPVGTKLSFWDTWKENSLFGLGSLSNHQLTASSPSGNSMILDKIGVASTDANPDVCVEITVNSFSFYPEIGIATTSETVDVGNTVNGWSWVIYNTTILPTPNSFIRNNNSFVNFGAGMTDYAATDIILIRLNMTAGTCTMYLNGVLVGTLVTGLTGRWHIAVGTYSGNAYNFTANFGATTLSGVPAGSHTMPGGAQAGIHQ